MEDKLMDELDVDFMREILGPSELQMADNLIHDIMTEYNNPNEINNSLNNSINQWPMSHQQQNVYGEQVHFYNEKNNFTSNNQQLNQQQQMLLTSANHSHNNNMSELGGYVMSSTADFNIQQAQSNIIHFMNNSTDANMNSILSSNSGFEVQTVPPILISNEMQQQQTSFQMAFSKLNENKFQNISQPNLILENSNATSNNKRVRKNLNDILKENTSTNSNTIILNQQDESLYKNFSNNILTPIIITSSPDTNNNSNYQIPLISQQKKNSMAKILNETNNPSLILDQNINSSNIHIVMSSPALNNSPSPTYSIGSDVSSITQKVSNSPASLASLSSVSMDELNDQSYIQNSKNNNNTDKKTTTNNDHNNNNKARIVSAASAAFVAAAVTDNLNTTTKATTKTKGEKKLKLKAEFVKENGTQLTAKRNKVSKRTSHNAIEKKYRSSINDKILELKNKVAGPNIKLQKSGILRKALDYLNNLESNMENLRKENQAYRSALQTIQLNSNNLTVIQAILNNLSATSSFDKRFVESTMPNTPPSSSPSDGDSQFSSADSDIVSTPSQFSLSCSPSDISSNNSRESPNPYNARRSKPAAQPRNTSKKVKKEPMNDSSRIFLCAFFMCVLFFNPFGLIMSQVNSLSSIPSGQQYSGSDGNHLNSRVLNWFKSSPLDENMTLPNPVDAAASSRIVNTGYLISIGLNAVLALFCIFRIYLKAEPHIDTENAEKLWLYYQRASKQFQKRNYDESFQWLERGLVELGQRAPKNKWQLVFGIMWQLTRLALNKFYVGHLFSRVNVWLNGESRTLKVYKLCALFYYEMSKFAYLNVQSEKDFTPKASIDESCLMGDSAADDGQHRVGEGNVIRGGFKSNSIRISITSYSYLLWTYFALATFNMSEVYSRPLYKKANSSRDEYNLGEFYMSICLGLNLFAPSALSRSLIKYLLKKKLNKKLGMPEDDPASPTENKSCKLRKLKLLLCKNIFLVYIINFENYTNLTIRPSSRLQSENSDEQEEELMHRQKALNFISFKRKLFKTESFLYNSDDSAANFEPTALATEVSVVAGQNGIATGFILAKFQDFVLYKMTSHVISHSHMISTERIMSTHQQSLCDPVDYLNKNVLCADVDEEQREQADIDQIKFDKLKALYKRNLEYFASASSAQQQETHAVLVEFLNMLNNWKIRNAEAQIENRAILLGKSNSFFIEAIRNVLKAYEHVRNEPTRALALCKEAVVCLKSFEATMNIYSTNYYLIEKFELLIYDWNLSAQTFIWTQNKQFELDLFNECLNRFQNLTVNNYPHLSSKAKMYETVLLYSTNRNPINLLNATFKQSTFSKCNQEAFFSINSILKNYHLHLIE